MSKNVLVIIGSPRINGNTKLLSMKKVVAKEQNRNVSL